MNTNQTYSHFYGVFCVASWMLKHYPDLFNNLDECWDDASALYEQFIHSRYNSPLRSELDCINEFMDDLSQTKL